MSEAHEILREYLRAVRNLKPPERKSDKQFKGYVFASILCEHLKKYVQRYDVVVGPLWVKGLEWIEWDAGIVKRRPTPQYMLYDPSDVVALLECKVSGIYGAREELQKCLERIQSNFNEAEECGIKYCFYVSLMEAKPKKKESIDYCEETKKELGERAFIFFNSRSVKAESGRDPDEIAGKAEELDGWENLVKVLQLL